MDMSVKPPLAAGTLPALKLTAARMPQLEQSLDPFGIGSAFAQIAEGWLAHPGELAAECAKLSAALQELQWHILQTAAGLAPPKVVRAAPDDARFSDPLWLKLPAYSFLKQFYLLYTHWLQEALFETPGVNTKVRRQATFWARQWLNAMAPSNFLLTNPVALSKAFDTGGKSLADGFKLFLDDLRNGDVQMVDRAPFVVGGNLAMTPGAVVYRNELMELIQYTPVTPTVHAVPIVIVPPWINKYYILDLNEKKTLVGWLVKQGYTVFVVSWKNPTAALAGTTFEDYMLKGVCRAVDTAREICNVPQAHAVGYCIGGSTLATTMAWLNRKFRDAAKVPVAHWTLFASLVDFSRPGAIEVFIDEHTIETLEKIMARQGYLDGREMARSFRMLRSNPLIWHYVVHNYLYGETPPAFDVLYWNTDVTRMPRAMHSFYLREFYLNNKLIQKDALEIAGEHIDLGAIRQPLYAVGCEEDHIAPWKATFRIGRIGAPVRYTLSSSGHILGIINPPVKPPKRWYWTGAIDSGSADDWLKRQQRVDGTWWEDWDRWLNERCGKKVPARQPGSVAFPVLCPAPGTYVHEI